MTQLTILTPTYQRRENLQKLYSTLCTQDNKNFVWLVFDDGSTDGTRDLVEKWIGENRINIDYRYKTNGGKQTVINEAMKIISNEMTFIVDSDDWLTNDAVSTIYQYYQKYGNDRTLCGFSFWRMFPDGTPNGPIFPYDDWKCTYFQSRILRHNGGDKAEVWFTKCLKEYPFPEYENEKCYPEDGIWMRLSGKYDMIHVNKGIYIGEYLKGGLSDSNISTRIEMWPKGMVDRALVYLERPCNLLTLVKQTMLYIIYGIYGANYSLTKLFDDCPRKGLFIALFVPAIILGKYYSSR